MFLKKQKSTEGNNFFYKVIIKFIILLSLTTSFAQTIEIKNLNINNRQNHFTIHVVGNKVYYTTNLKSKKGRNVKDNSKGNVYTIYEGALGDDGEILKTEPITRNGKEKISMSVATFSSDGRFMYFTTNNRSLGVNKSKGYKTFNLQIQRAEYIEGKGWSNFNTLPFCKTDFSYGHPALSPDGSTLYFVANLKGTKGKTDIYKVSVENHKTYSEPQKLSETINSPRTEVYPFVSGDNKLFFSSNRRGSIGGYDIYSYDLTSSDKTQEPVGLPEPINSIGEEFSFFLMDDLKSGYLTSRRLRGKGSDDLYYFSNL